MKYIVLFVTYFGIHFKDGQTYKAAILEHNPMLASTPSDTIQENIKMYKTFVEKAANKGADIIVFPEYGLTTLQDVPNGYAIQFTSDNQVLRQFSAIALEYSIYLVVNLLEEVKDTTKTKYYNTNIIYDRKGNIITKYRKINLFNEPNLTPGNETVTFQTDFGVTFGVLTCFDILYYHPSRTILQNPDVTDIVYPLAWFSTMPFYTALTVQHGYFATHNVNLLATNYGRPEEGHGGSGIYIANGRVANIFISDTLGSKLLIQDITESKKKHHRQTCVSKTHPRPSIASNQTHINNYLLYRDFKAADYTFKNIDLSQKETSSRICHGQFCCHFEITIAQPNPEETYKLMAYDGKVIFDRSYVHISVCSLLACQNGTDDSCGTRNNGTTKFTKISVEGSVKKDSTTFYTPVTLSYSLLPIFETTYCDSASSGTTLIRLSTNGVQTGVLVFGIFGKNDSSIL